MGIFNGIKKFFTGGGEGGERIPTLNQNALTPDSFTPNDSNLYTSSQLVREANNRGWIIDNELVQQSGEIAKNAKQNSKNVKKFGKNIKTLSKAELDTSRQMQKMVGLVAKNDSQKYEIVTETQSLLDAQLIAHQTIRANYKERMKQIDADLKASLNTSQSKRDKLKGR